jgi:DNA-binding transcriptional ArsR family regulator
MDAAAHAIADPWRRGILEALAQHPQSAGALADLFPISRPAVSRHLRVLRESGLVSATVEGRHRVYRAALEHLEPLEAWIRRLRQPAEWPARFDALETEVARASRDHRDGQHRRPTTEKSA